MQRGSFSKFKDLGMHKQTPLPHKKGFKMPRTFDSPLRVTSPKNKSPKKAVSKFNNHKDEDTRDNPFSMTTSRPMSPSSSVVVPYYTLRPKTSNLLSARGSQANILTSQSKVDEEEIKESGAT